MSTSAEDTGSEWDVLDPFLHAPARLRILALLYPADWVTFGYLRDSVGTSDSALSKQLQALDAAGYLEGGRGTSTRRRTTVRLSSDGRRSFDAYLAGLEALVDRARVANPGT